MIPTILMKMDKTHEGKKIMLCPYFYVNDCGFDFMPGTAERNDYVDNFCGAAVLELKTFIKNDYYATFPCKCNLKALQVQMLNI